MLHQFKKKLKGCSKNLYDQKNSKAVENPSMVWLLGWGFAISHASDVSSPARSALIVSGVCTPASAAICNQVIPW